MPQCSIVLSVPLILRILEWIFCLITFSAAVGGTSGIIYDKAIIGSGQGSQTSFNFMIFTGIVGWLSVSCWIIVFNIMKRYYI